MDTMKLQLNEEMMFSEIRPSQINSSFDEAIVRIACTGDNANGSNFSDLSFEKALPSLKNIPIVALYKEGKGDFGSHETSYEIVEGEFKVVHNTFPFGVIHESAKQHYEYVEENGEMKKYLVSECLLWKRQKSYNLIKENGAYSVSMEIEVKSGQFNDKSIYNIDDFIFTAIAVLGQDVQPCFKNAEIKLFSENVEYSEMLNAYKMFALESFKGGENVNDEVLKVEDEEVVEEQVVEVEETIETTSEEVTNEEEVVDVVEDVEIKDDIETQDEEVVDDVVEPSFEQKYNELQVEYGRVVKELDEIKVEFTRLQKFELDVLAEKRLIEEQELFAKFSMLNGVEEFEVLKGECSQYSLKDVENLCYSLVGRQAFTSKQKVKSPTQTSVKLDFSSKQDDKPLAYGGILG